MPRAKRHKNRYCWNTKLSEEVFLKLLKEYCTGTTASTAADVLFRWCERRKLKPVSRPSVSTLFLRLGDYLLARFFAIDHNWPIEHWGPVLRIMFDVTYGQVDFDEMRKKVGDETSNLLFYEILRERSKSHSGLEYPYFAAHVGYASHKKTAFELARMKTNKVDNESASHELFKCLKTILKDEPLGSVEFPVVRMHREVRDGVPMAFFTIESSSPD